VIWERERERERERELVVIFGDFEWNCGVWVEEGRRKRSTISKRRKYRGIRLQAWTFKVFGKLDIFIVHCK
jgi:hypothetical protein